MRDDDLRQGGALKIIIIDDTTTAVDFFLVPSLNSHLTLFSAFSAPPHLFPPSPAPLSSPAPYTVLLPSRQGDDVVLMHNDLCAPNLSPADFDRSGWHVAVVQLGDTESDLGRAQLGLYGEAFVAGA